MTTTLGTRAKGISTCMPRPAPKPATPYEVPPHHYQGTELQAYNGRPGAMDAFALPSLLLGKLIWRNGKTETLP